MRGVVRRNLPRAGSRLRGRNAGGAGVANGPSSPVSYDPDSPRPRWRPFAEGEAELLVAASTECFHQLSLAESLKRLVDLEYSHVEVAIHEDLDQLKPSVVAGDLEWAIDTCRNTNRLDVVAYSLRLAAEGEAYYDQFAACCRLAKATKVVSITVESGELGTPFNQEVERLRRLVAIASLEGTMVSIKSQVGRLSEDPDTVTVLCDNVDGLGLTLDPSHYICGPARRQKHRQVNEVRVPRAPAGHEQTAAPGPRWAGRGRIRPARSANFGRRSTIEL